MINRRVFLIKALVATAATTSAGFSFAQAAGAPMLKEADVKAVEFGYKEDTARVDQIKFPLHTPKQTCGGCELYGDGPDGAGTCPLFPNTKVAVGGWCSSFG